MLLAIGNGLVIVIIIIIVFTTVAIVAVARTSAICCRMCLKQMCLEALKSVCMGAPDRPPVLYHFVEAHLLFLLL